MSAVPSSRHATAQDSAPVQALYRKLNWRLLPLLLLCYTFAYLDRVNIGFAKLHMQSALGFSDAAYGLGAGIFFSATCCSRSRATCFFRRSAHARQSAGSWCCGA